MKNIKALPISIVSIILIAFCAVSFILYDASETVAIRGIEGSYAQTYANENDVEFIAIDDSENDQVEIPSVNGDEESTLDPDENEEETTERQTEKENELFSYNYENEAVTITAYKGVSDTIIIPQSIDNLPVKNIDLDVLGKGISVVEIPESVTEIHTQFTSPRYTASFFTVIAIMALGYLFAIASTIIGFKKSNTAEDTFYGVPFVYSGLVTYIFITVWSAVSMAFAFSPVLQILVAVVIFAIAIAKLLKKSVARELVVERGEAVKQKTAFVTTLSADADSLTRWAKNEEIKSECKRVYETIRYSDPMSNDALAGIESQIQNEFYVFSDAVKDGDTELVKSSADRIVTLVHERNNKCKLLK